MSNHYDDDDWGDNFLGIKEDIWEDARYIAWVEDALECEREVEYIDRVADEIEAEQSLDDQG